jgi:hypothetical protein
VYSDLDLLDLAMQLLELDDLPDEKLAVAMRHLGVSNVDHVMVDVEIKFGSRLELALKSRGALAPDKVLHLVLEAEQVDDELLGLLGQIDLGDGALGRFGARLLRHEGGQLGHRQCRVQLEVRADRRQHLLLANFVHEHVGLVLHRFLDQVFRVGALRARRQELGAAKVEALLKLLQVTILHLVHLLVHALLAQRLLNGLVHAHGVQHQADGQQRVHLVSLLIDLQEKHTQDINLCFLCR